MSNPVFPLGIMGLQVITLLGVPVLWLWLRNTQRRFLAEELWVLGVLAASLQAITGSLWSLLTPYPSTGQLWIWGLCGIGVGELWHRWPRPVEPLTSKRAFAGIAALAWVVRFLPAFLDSGLGQSDAYSHLQFGVELLETGRLSHYIYPAGYGWIHVLPLKLFQLDPYLLYRFGGASAGVAMVIGCFFVMRRATNENVARCAALLVAACPLFLPLIKTGVGVFPNQFGLLLLPFLLWSVPKHFGLSLLAYLALGLSVPIMALDILPVFLIYLCLKKEFRKLAGCLLVGLAGSVLIWVQLSNLSPLHLEVTLHLLTHDHAVQTIPHLLLHYLSPKDFSYPWPIQIVIGGATLLSGCGLFFRPFRKKEFLLLPLLVLYSGLQTTFGLCQFANYQRAGWVFLLGAALLIAWASWTLANRLQGQKILCPLIALSSILLLVHPVSHQKQLSLAEDQLVEFLWDLSKREFEAPVYVWSRPLNTFGGRQGDPVYVFLADRSRFKLRRPLNTLQEEPDPKQRTIVILETVAPPQTGNREHDEIVRVLWEENQLLRKSLNSVTGKEEVSGYPGLEIWYWPAELFKNPE